MGTELARLRDGRWEERRKMEEQIREVSWRLDEHLRESRRRTLDFAMGVYYVALVGFVVAVVVVRLAGG